MQPGPSAGDDLSAQIPGATSEDGAPEADLPPKPERPAQLVRIAALIMAVAITVTLVLFREHLVRFAGLGYAGLFIIGALGSATVILPMPGLALAFAAGSSLTPWLVGLAFGTGAALGELTGYLAGYGGSAILSDQFFIGRIVSLLRRWGAWMVFVLGVIPNPAFDIVGVTAGALRIPVWQFLIAAWAGNVLKATMVAYAGAGTVDTLAPLIEQWLGE